jgi:microcystin degradation protein MlrC
MRILIGAIGHESNTFTPFLTRLADFRPRYGAEILDRPRRHGAFGGIVHTLQASGAELVPTVAAHAPPGGVVERSAYQAFKEALLAEAHDVDGACLFLHGAMRAEGIDCCENEILRDLRWQLGPDVPISVALDMHANILAEMAENADAMVAYHEAPHTDAYETGVKAAEMLLQILQGGAHPEIGFAKIPFLLPGEFAQTALDPMAAMMRMVRDVEARPGVLSASLANGHCWADVPDIGVAAVVVTDGDRALAQAEANELAAAFWAERHAFGPSAEAYPVEAAVEAAMAAPEVTVFLSDSGDNPGAGGTTDVPAVLQALLGQGAQNAVVAAIWDAAAVETCAAAGVGQHVSLAIGGKIDTQRGRPLPVTGTVRTLSDGTYYWGGLREPQRRVEQGPIAVLSVEGVDVVLSARRVDIHEPAQLRILGIDPLAYHIVVPKRGYLTAPLEAISPRSILALSPGCTNCDVTQMAFHRVKRPIYPLDADATWAPGA